MRPDEKVAEPAAEGFVSTPILWGEWRRRTALRPIPVALTIADEHGRPTVAFQGVCRAAFNRAPPIDAIVDEGGRATRYFVTWLDR